MLEGDGFCGKEKSRTAVKENTGEGGVPTTKLFASGLVWMMCSGMYFKEVKEQSISSFLMHVYIHFFSCRIALDSFCGVMLKAGRCQLFFLCLWSWVKYYYHTYGVCCRIFECLRKIHSILVFLKKPRMGELASNYILCIIWVDDTYHFVWSGKTYIGFWIFKSFSFKLTISARIVQCTLV